MNSAILIIAQPDPAERKEAWPNQIGLVVGLIILFVMFVIFVFTRRGPGSK